VARSRRAPVLLFLLVAAGLAAPAAASARTVWLCKPGLAGNPCSGDLDTASFSPAGAPLGVREPRAQRHRAIDCFYVYPTVSDQPAPAATRRIDPEERSIARFQAARFSRTCRVLAPMYRQLTVRGLGGGADPGVFERAYEDVREAWRTYLTRHNHARGFVLIGHSQGTVHLGRLLAEEIEGARGVRRRLVSALLLGGNVTVAAGRDTGGSFRRTEACRAPDQIGCVVAYSTFGGPPPPDALFGRAQDGREVLCTNPAALGGGAGALDPIWPSEPFAARTVIGAAIAATGIPAPSSPATWLAFPHAYSARSVNEAGASALQVAPAPGAPALAPVPTPGWGLHLVDVNIALGNLERLVRRQATAYLRARGR
jgi:Protein of unknown function (DUF3089)